MLCVICLTVFRFCGCVQARDFCASVISKKLLVFANAQYSSIASVHYFFLPSSVFRNKDRLTAEKLSGYVVGLWGFLRLMTCIFVCLAWWLQSSKNWYKKRRWRRQHLEYGRGIWWKFRNGDFSNHYSEKGTRVYVRLIIFLVCRFQRVASQTRQFIDRRRSILLGGEFIRTRLKALRAAKSVTVLRRRVCLAVYVIGSGQVCCKAVLQLRFDWNSTALRPFNDRIGLPVVVCYTSV